MKKTIYYLILIAATLLQGCIHKELDEYQRQTVKVRINFDWDKAPQADVEVMRLYMYNTLDNGKCEVYELPKDGGIIKITSGIYNLICYNWDNIDSTTPTQWEQYHTHHLTTREGNYITDAATRSIARYAQSQNDTIRVEPNMMWGAHGTDITIEQLTDNNTTNGNPDDSNIDISNGIITITVHPAPLTARYTFEINRVKNIQSASILRGTLSGMGALHRLSDGSTTTDYTAKVPFVPKMDISRDRIYGEFYTFGNFDEIQDIQKEFALYVWLSNKERYLYRWDMSRQVTDARDPLNVHLVMDSLTLPESFDVGGGGGFDIDIDGWDEEFIDITM